MASKSVKRKPGKSTKKPKWKLESKFINRQKELKYLEEFIANRPEKIIFMYGPKSVGKTALLQKWVDNLNESKDSKYDIKFISLRRLLITNFLDFIREIMDASLWAGFKRTLSTTKINLGVSLDLNSLLSSVGLSSQNFFKQIEEGVKAKVNKGIKPIYVIDEIQELDEIYTNGGKALLKELLNFFVSLNKETHLAHCIVASSDMFFLEKIYEDSKLKKTSAWYEINYLSKADVMQWILVESRRELEENMRIYLTEDDAEKIWDTVGGSCYEINSILLDLNTDTLDNLLQKMVNEWHSMFELMQKDNPVDYQYFLQFKESKRILAKNLKMPMDVIKQYVDKNILYYDPITKVVSFQGRVFEKAIDKLI